MDHWRTRMQRKRVTRPLKRVQKLSDKLTIGPMRPRASYRRHPVGARNKIKTIVGDFGQLLLGACARADKYGKDKRYSDFMKETDILGLLLVPFCNNL
jgi:hypothetical protein